MGKLIDRDVSIIQADFNHVNMAMNYITECYPIRPDETHESLRKFQVDDRRTMIQVIFQELDQLVWDGAMSMGVAYNDNWNPGDDLGGEPEDE